MKAACRQLLLFASTTGYQIRVFAGAARRLGVELALASDRCHVLDDPWGDRATPVRFDRIEESIERFRGRRFDGIAAAGDRPAILAAAAAEALGIPFHPPAATRAANDKYLARQLYRARGLRVPWFFRANAEERPETLTRVSYPCVLKPTSGSASHGVIRANDKEEFIEAFRRIRRMGEQAIQIEGYIEGREFAVEALVTDGRFQPLAIFEKPDILEGPFFEETIYVTPTREPAQVQAEILETTEQAVQALGLRHGPVHAELRYNNAGPWILETAARPIGGLCARALQFERGIALEELILRHALGENIGNPRLAWPASGVMMIPICKSGIYETVEGLEEARAVPGIEDIIITAKPGQHLLTWPEGSSYLGFIFASGRTPEKVESALREAHGRLRFVVATALETLKLEAPANHSRPAFPKTYSQ